MIIIILSLSVFLIRLAYLFLFTGRILFRKKTSEGNRNTPLSLILTIRNDEENLRNYLPELLEIEGIDYEVVVVDDFSQDNSYLVLGTLRKKYPRLKISTLNEETRYSFKLAQNIAIKGTSNDWVLNLPVAFEHQHEKWLSCFATGMDESKNLVIGYAGIKKEAGLGNRLCRLEQCFSFIKSTGYILNNLPVVYSDENVAFRKEEYFKLRGYREKIKEPYANLELLINLFSRKKSTTVLLSGESSIRKTEAFSFPGYLDLLKKQFRIEQHLPFKKRFFLFADEITRLVYLPLFILVLYLLPELWFLIVPVPALHFIAGLLILKTLQKRLNERKIFLSSLIYAVFAMYFKLVYRMIFHFRSRNKKWRNKA